MTTESELGEAFLKVTVKALAAVVPGGASIVMAFEELAAPFGKAAWRYLEGLVPDEREAALKGLAQTTTARAEHLVRVELDKTALNPQVKDALVALLAQVPVRARNAVQQHDRTGSQTLLAVAATNERTLARYLPLRPPALRAGTRIPHHDYQLEELLGQGGFGEVWIAANTRRTTMPPVAIKFCLDEKLASSLVREVDLIDHLSHGGGSPYIVRLLETALTAEPPFLVFEYVEGADLTTWLSSHGTSPVPEKDVVRILTMTARGLSHAHQRDVVHRDLKPSNLLVARSGQVKIADFGIGQLVQAAGRTPNTTMQQVTALHGAGTPMYLDPETSDGKQRDIYALGVIAYQLLVGDVAHGVPAGWRTRLQYRKVSADLIDVVDKCLTVPSHRFADAIELAAVLEPLDRSREPVVPAAAHDEVAESSLQPFEVPSPSIVAKRRWLAAAAAALMVLALITVRLLSPPAEAKGDDALPPSPETASTAGQSSAAGRTSAAVMASPQASPEPVQAPAPEPPAAPIAASDPPAHTGEETIRLGNALGHTGTGTIGLGNAAGHTGTGTAVLGNTASGSVGAGKPQVSGSLPPEVILRILKSHTVRVRKCYEQGLSDDPKLQGRITVNFTISETGSVQDARIGSSTLGNEAVARCIVGVIKRASFPTPEGGSVAVAYPIVFQPST